MLIQQDYSPIFLTQYKFTPHLANEKYFAFSGMMVWCKEKVMKIPDKKDLSEYSDYDISSSFSQKYHVKPASILSSDGNKNGIHMWANLIDLLNSNPIGGARSLLDILNPLCCVESLRVGSFGKITACACNNRPIWVFWSEEEDLQSTLDWLNH